MTKKYLEVKIRKDVVVSKKFQDNMKKTFNQARIAVCKDHDECQGEYSMLELLQWIKQHQPLDYETIMYAPYNKRPFVLCDDYGLISKFLNGDIEVSPIGEWVLEKGCPV